MPQAKSMGNPPEEMIEAPLDFNSFPDLTPPAPEVGADDAETLTDGDPTPPAQTPADTAAPPAPTEEELLAQAQDEFRQSLQTPPQPQADPLATKLDDISGKLAAIEKQSLNLDPTKVPANDQEVKLQLDENGNPISWDHVLDTASKRAKAELKAEQEALRAQEQAEQQRTQAEQQRVERVIDGQLTALKTKQLIKTPEEERKLLETARDYGVPDLFNAYKIMARNGEADALKAQQKAAQEKHAARRKDLLGKSHSGNPGTSPGTSVAPFKSGEQLSRMSMEDVALLASKQLS